jgi:hypothetical protein
MLLSQSCLTFCHVSGIFAEGFTWLITAQSLSLDLFTLRLRSFTSSVFQCYLGISYPLLGSLVLSLYTNYSIPS